MKKIGNFLIISLLLFSMSNLIDLGRGFFYGTFSVWLWFYTINTDFDSISIFPVVFVSMLFDVFFGLTFGYYTVTVVVMLGIIYFSRRIIAFDNESFHGTIIMLFIYTIIFNLLFVPLLGVNFFFTNFVYMLLPPIISGSIFYAFK